VASANAVGMIRKKEPEPNPACGCMLWNLLKERRYMAIARLFWSSGRQMVALPRGFRIKGKEVEIFRRGDEIVLREKRKGLGRAFEIIANLPDDFLADGRRDTPPQERKGQ
jgi:antitoxin VapB